MAKAITSMYTRLGFTATAAGLLAVDQGMDNINELNLLRDEGIGALVKAVKHPGDTTGTRGAAVSGLGQGVSMRACTNLKLTCFFICHQQRMSRAHTPASVTLDNIRTLCALCAAKAAHKDLQTRLLLPLTDHIDPNVWRLF